MSREYRRELSGRRGPALRKAYPDYNQTHLASGVATAVGMWAGSIKLAERKAAQNAAPVWMYMTVAQGSPWAKMTEAGGYPTIFREAPDELRNRSGSKGSVSRN